MKSSLSNCRKPILPLIPRRVARFAACESGATTAEFAIVAAVVVALGVGAVSTTRGGATVSANNTATAIEAQAPTFEKLADGQQAVRTAYAPGAGSSGGTNPQTSQNINVMPALGGGSAPAGEATNAQTDASDQNAGAETAEGAQTAEQGAETSAEQAAEQSAETDSQETGTETAQGQGSSGGGGTILPDGEAENIEEPEETEVAQIVKPGCENPYNKRGNIKRKCR